MLAGIAPANVSPADHRGITRLSVGTTSIPIVVGLIRTMDPSPAMRSDSTIPVSDGKLTPRSASLDHFRTPCPGQRASFAST